MLVGISHTTESMRMPSKGFPLWYHWGHDENPVSGTIRWRWSIPSSFVSSLWYILTLFLTFPLPLCQPTSAVHRISSCSTSLTLSLLFLSSVFEPWDSFLRKHTALHLALCDAGGEKKGSSKGRAQFMSNRRSPVKGRVMSLAFGRLWRCSLVSYQMRLTKTLRMPNVSWVSFFSYKECAKNSPTHACCLVFSFCLISL